MYNLSTQSIPCGKFHYTGILEDAATLSEKNGQAVEPGLHVCTFNITLASQNIATDPCFLQVPVYSSILEVCSGILADTWQPAWKLAFTRGSNCEYLM
jgi:hypothetical protein